MNAASSSTELKKNWHRAARVFHERAEEYDNWFEHNPVFASELSALQKITQHRPEPQIEIGAGPGRFAEQLGVSIGIDPAHAALQRASNRGIIGIVGIGEHLPIKTEAAGTIFLLFTLCFLVDPCRVLKECYRALKQDGRLVIGQVPATSSWGKLLETKKQKGNSYYKHGRFYSIAETIVMLEQENFTLVESHSVLLNPPDRIKNIETAKDGINEQAGFCVLVAEKMEKNR